MNVLNFSAGADTGGQGIRIKRAFDRWSDWEYRTVVRSLNYIGYPTDLPSGDWLAAWKKADVVHVNNSFRRIRPDKPLVIHYHGTNFRNNPVPLLKEQHRRGAVGLASTLDLWLIAPDRVEWLPTPYDLEWLAGLRAPVDDGVFRVAHAPTDRTVKSTGPFLEAVDRLSQEIPVELVLVEGSSWVDCLKLKAAADVYFDQVLLGYGNNAIEAWGMGIPVICGAAADTLAEMRNRFGELPFYEATEPTIYDALKTLSDPSTRTQFSTLGLNHVRRFHDEQLVVRQLETVYTRLQKRNN